MGFERLDRKPPRKVVDTAITLSFAQNRHHRRWIEPLGLNQDAAPWRSGYSAGAAKLTTCRGWPIGRAIYIRDTRCRVAGYRHSAPVFANDHAIAEISITIKLLVNFPPTKTALKHFAEHVQFE